MTPALYTVDLVESWCYFSNCVERSFTAFEIYTFVPRADRAARFEKEKMEKEQAKQREQEAKEAAEQEEQTRLQASKRLFLLAHPSS